jgi:hypothetical protein
MQAVEYLPHCVQGWHDSPSVKNPASHSHGQLRLSAPTSE